MINLKIFKKINFLANLQVTEYRREKKNFLKKDFLKSFLFVNKVYVQSSQNVLVACTLFKISEYQNIRM